MNVASPELCQELRFLSGSWINTDFVWYKKFDEPNWSLGYDMIGRTVSAWLPAYDLGYLLRQLIDGDVLVDTEMLCIEDSEGITHGSAVRGAGEGLTIADTPENSIAMLAIELFKSGILRKEE